MLRNLLFVVLVLTAGCSSGEGAVYLTIGSDRAIGGIDHFRVAAMNANMESMPGDVPLSGAPVAIPPPIGIQVRFPKGRSGSVSIHVDAIDHGGRVLAGGDTTANLSPGSETNAQLILRNGSPPVDGGTNPTPDLALPAPDLAANATPDLALPDLAPPADLTSVPDLVNPSGWTLQNSGTTNTLYSVYGFYTGDVYAVGDQGTILYTNDQGMTWTAQNSGTTSSLYGVWGSGPGDIYVVGASGTILHSADGSTWSPQSNPATQRLSAVWGSGGNDVYVVGVNGVILHSANGGATWTPQMSNSTGRLFSISGNSSLVLAVGDAVLHTSNGGLTWTSSDPAPFAVVFQAVSNPGPAGFFVVTSHGTIIKTVDAMSWAGSSSGVTHTLNGVWNSGAYGVWVTDDNGEILRSIDQGVHWTTTPCGCGQKLLYGVWGTTDIYVVGGGGVILHGPP